MSADGRLGGVCPVVETPFTAEGDIDLPSFERLLVHLIGTGVTSMMFPGFASEFHKLSDDEVEQLTETYVTVLARHPRVAPIVSVPTHSTLLARRLARNAAELGAAAINVLPPHFLGPTQEHISAHIDGVLADVAPLPVIVQYAPDQTGTALDADTLRELATRHPNRVIVKVESTPPEEFIAALATHPPRLASFVGYAGLALPAAFRAGAAGVQPGCSFTELYVDIWEAYARGDAVYADDAHARLRPYLEDWMDSVEHIVAVEKAISARRGLISTGLVRFPGWVLSDNDKQRIDHFFVEFGDRLGSVA